MVAPSAWQIGARRREDFLRERLDSHALRDRDAMMRVDAARREAELALPRDGRDPLNMEPLPVLGFRHFFRHAYAVAFDPARLEGVARDALSARAQLALDLDRFEVILGARS